MTTLGSLPHLTETGHDQSPHRLLTPQHRSTENTPFRPTEQTERDKARDGKCHHSLSSSRPLGRLKCKAVRHQVHTGHPHCLGAELHSKAVKDTHRHTHLHTSSPPLHHSLHQPPSQLNSTTIHHHLPHPTFFYPNAAHDTYFQRPCQNQPPHIPSIHTKPKRT